MGGLGSGLWSDVLKRKTAVEQCLVLSVKSLRVSGFLTAGLSGVVSWSNAAGEVVRRAEIEMQGQRLKLSDYYIKLERTACNYGGWRYWFLCPVVKDGVLCENRCSKLYLPPGGKFFGCRHCYDLTYQSCQESHKYDKVFGHIENAEIDSLSVTQALRLGGL